MRDTPRLRPCPCCDGPPQYATGIHGARFQVYVYCCHCSMRTEIGETYDTVAADWNKRPTTNLTDPAARRFLREAMDLRSRLASADAFSGALLREMTALRRERDTHAQRLRGESIFRRVAAQRGVSQDVLQEMFLRWVEEVRSA